MAIIKCPECKKKVSDNASTCPKCGFPIKGYVTSTETLEVQQKNRKRVKRILIILCAIILSVCLVGSGIYIYGEYSYAQITKQKEEEAKKKYPLFTKSDVISMDIYGLANENNILGKTTVMVLKGYVENKDYSTKKEKDCVTYTFSSLPNSNFYFADAIILYESNELINKVEYEYRRLRSGNTFLREFSNTEYRDQVTGFYDVDPDYIGYMFDSGKYTNMNKTEFEARRYEYDVCFIIWKSSKGNAMYCFTNMFDEKDEYAIAVFTDNKTKIDKKTYIDRFKSLKK